MRRAEEAGREEGSLVRPPSEILDEMKNRKHGQDDALEIVFAIDRLTEATLRAGEAIQSLEEALGQREGNGLRVEGL